DQEAPGLHVAGDRAAAEGVEHVDQVVVNGDAHRELAARADHLAKGKPVAVHGEHANRVAAGVDRVEQAGLLVVGERPLGGDVVDDGPGQDPAIATGRVAADLLQAAPGGARV